MAQPQLTQEQFNQLQAEYEKTITPESVKSEEQYNAGLDKFINRVLTRQAFEGMEGSARRGATAALPIAGSIAGGMLAGPLIAGMSIPAAAAVGGLAAGAGGAAGETGRQVLSGEELRPRDIATTGAWEGATNAAGTGLALTAAKQIAPRVMKAAFGTQAALRNKFPSLNLEELALNAGTTLTNAGAKVTNAARTAAGKAVGVAARAADAMGVPKIQPREIVKGLAPIYDEARRAREFGDVSAVVDEVNRLKDVYKTGATVEDALIGKTYRQQRAATALPSAGDKSTAPALAKEMDSAVARKLNEAARKRSPAVAEALDKSQETIFLDRASKAALASGGWRQPISRSDVVLGALGAAGLGTAGEAVADQPGIGGAVGLLLPLLTRSPAGLSILANQIMKAKDPIVRESLRGLFEAAVSAVQGEEKQDASQPNQ